jgi:hypothetical protein
VVAPVGVTRRRSIPEFLDARIAEDEEGARIHPREWWSTRLEAECEAKRQIVAEHPHLMFMVTDPKPAACDRCQVRGWCRTLRLLALPYVDHPDYRQEWKP